MPEAAKRSELYPDATNEAAADDQYQLGLDYSTGHEGMPVDYVMAHMWLNVAAMHGSEAARALRREISEYMSREEVAEAQRLAREWVGRTH